MKKPLSKYAQVAKLLKQKAKKLGMKATASSQSFAGGNSVDVVVTAGSNDALQELRNFSKQFVYGKFDGMTDYYDITNWREDIPQTKYLFIQDDRAYTILKNLNEKYWELSYVVNGKEVGYLSFINQLKEIFFKNNGWQSVLNAFVNEKAKFPFGGSGYLFEIKNKEVTQ